MFRLFKRKPKLQDEPNPWLKIPHEHNWLPASAGKEFVCGDCGLRRKVGEKCEERSK